MSAKSQSIASTAQSGGALVKPKGGPRRTGDAVWYRRIVIGLLAVAVLSPIILVVYQSFLDAPFFLPRAKLSLAAYAYVLTDHSFYSALWMTLVMSFGITIIAVPLGAVLAFLLTRTDIRGRSYLEVVVLIPMFISSIVLAFGYTVSLGPAGYVSLFMRSMFGVVPWYLYTVTGIILIGGISHIPYAYLYVSAAMRNLPTDLEEAARTAGASVWRVLWDVTIPLVFPALVFVTALNLLLGFEMFGLPLVLGDPEGIAVLTTYILKLTTLFGVPVYQLMAVVALVIVLMTLPLVFVQRYLLRNSRRYAALGGKGGRATPLHLGKTAQIVAMSFICLWILVGVVLPVSGIVIRAFTDAWGMGVNIFEHLTLSHFKGLFGVPILERSILNTVLLATVGGAGAVLIYLLIAFAGHRNTGASNTLLDYMVLLPRAVPGLLIGLAFFWLFLFIPILQPIRPTIFAMFVAYAVVGLSYGLRLIQGVLIQVGPELEESARTTGATIKQSWRDIVMPIARPGLVGAWVLIMIIFIRDYATGFYLMTAGTEVIGALMISLMATGAMDTIAALSFVSVILTAAGLALALRLGVKMDA